MVVAGYGRRREPVLVWVLGHLVNRHVMLRRNTLYAGDDVIHHCLVDLVTSDGVNPIEVPQLWWMRSGQLVPLLLAEGLPPPLDVFGLCIRRWNLQLFGFVLRVYRLERLGVVAVGPQGGERVLQGGRVAVAGRFELAHCGLGVADRVVFARVDESVERVPVRGA